MKDTGDEEIRAEERRKETNKESKEKEQGEKTREQKKGTEKREQITKDAKKKEKGGKDKNIPEYSARIWGNSEEETAKRTRRRNIQEILRLQEKV